ncbi:MAG: AAA family ATPase [Caldilineaceae bacterium]|nr:AAA family ATPase [Caldilineaceae bacterium]
MATLIDIDHSNLAEIVHQAFKELHGDGVGKSLLSKSVLFRTLANREAFQSEREVVTQMLEAAIGTLKETRPQDAQLLELRFMDNCSVLEVAQELHVGESTVYARQHRALKNLAEIIRSRERQARADRRDRLMRRLPPASYGPLVGVEPLLAEALAVAQAPGSPWIVALHGIGGIGKTALAAALACHVVENGHFDEVGWVSAQPARLTRAGEILSTSESALTAKDMLRRLTLQLMPELANGARLSDEQVFDRLQQRLREVPHLVVVDNLETLADLNALMPLLRRLVAPTRFLLTSRDSLVGESNVYSVLVAELDRANASTCCVRKQNGPTCPAWPPRMTHSSSPFSRP